VLDGRLLVPAGAAWIGAALQLMWGPWPVVGFACGAGLFAVVARGLRAMLVLAALFLAVGALAAVLLQSRLAPLEAWAQERVTATVTGAIAGEARLHRAPATGQWWATDSVSVRLNTQHVSARGRTIEVALPVQLRLPGAAQPPPRGTLVTLTGRLAPAAVNSGLAAEVRVSAAGLTPLALPGPIDRLATQMRDGLATSVAHAPADSGSLVQGLTIGDDSTQSEELTTAMRASGLAHLVAVSGGNVAIVVGLVVGLATVLRLALWLRVGAGIVAVAYYAFLVGPEPSVLRASVMGVVVLVGVLAGGGRGGPAVLGTGVLGLVLVQPSLALSWGFALSVLATAGLLLLAPRIRRGLESTRVGRRAPPMVLIAVALTLAAQVSTLPVLVAMGGAVGWVAVPANLAAMPAVAPVTALGLAAAIISPVSEPVAAVMGGLASWPAGWIAWIAMRAPALPAAEWPVGYLPAGWWGVAAVAAVMASVVLLWRITRSALWRAMGRGVKRLILATSVVGMTLIIIRPPHLQGWPPPGWLIIMCDVGQGDSLLLRAGDQEAVVVDTGNDADRVSACIDDAGVVAIPAVVLTHFHADHVAGIAGVLTGRDVGIVLTSPLQDPQDQARLVHEVASASVQVPEPITAGDARRVGQVSWRALWPRRIIRAGSVPNNASVVLLVEVAGTSVLLTGDIEPEAQRAILGEVPRVDIVKVPHHGSRLQLQDFADAASAPVALISVGEGNDYGHPAKEALDLYGSRGAIVLRTDLLGDVAIVQSEPGGDLGVVTRGGMLPSS